MADAVVRTAGSAGRRIIITTDAVRALTESTTAMITGIQWLFPRALDSVSEEESGIEYSFDSEVCARSLVFAGGVVAATHIAYAGFCP